MRLVNRTSVLFLGSVVSAGLVACGGDDGGGGDDTIDPAGTNNTYVVSALKVPSSVNEATMLGLDIDDVATDTAMGGIDNSLGNSLGTFAGQGINLQPSLTESVDQGSILLLANLKAKALDNASGVGMWVYLGQDSTPPACMDANDTVCRKHLTGTASFTLDPAGPTDAKLAGRIMGGHFTGGPGTIGLQLALAAGQPPVALTLQKAKADMIVTANGFGPGSKLGGAILQTDIETKIHPAIQMLVAGILDEDCGPEANRGNTAPCMCTAGSTGNTVMGLMDTAAPKDCRVTVAEVTAFLNPIIQKDIDVDGDGTKDAVSLGLGVEAVKGTFTVP